VVDHFQDIYTNKAALYDAMVAREDYQGNLLPAIQRIASLATANVIEFGAGTGRLTRLLAPHVARITACDVSHHMLLTGRPTLPQTINWSLAVADNNAMPFVNNSADVTIAGWSFGHATGWTPDNWREVIGAAVAEMQRLTRDGGTLIILETLGTGRETPAPPNQALADYYHWLESEHGFNREWLRTDYQFGSVEEADRLMRFFFGDDFAERVRAQNWQIVPECTGLWWRRA
jgi:ubiquinone/menaquinone biosynthesis C-methylase UbiE